MGMQQNLSTWFVLLTLMCVNNIGYCRFLGGTISWVPDISTNAVRFTYRLSWEKGTGPCGSTCSPEQIGKNVTGFVNSSILSSLHWKYTDGNTTNTLSDINYYVTSVSKISTIGWEQGENSFTSNGFWPNRTSKVYLESLPWVRSYPDTSDKLGYMETKVDIRVRSDTAKPNSSPYVSVPPFLGVAFGCSTRIRLPADDPDGDIVRCRWALPTECGQACTNVPTDGVKLNKANCTLTIHAFSELALKVNATYRLAIIVEDFPHGLIDVGGENITRSRPLSRVPIQFTVKTSPASRQCGSQESALLNPFGETNYRTYLSRNSVKYQTPINSKLISFPNSTTNSTDMLASIPRFTTYTIVQNTLISGESQISIHLAPTSSQYGYIQFCFWLLRMNGVTTAAGCKIYTVNDDYLCKSGTCKNNGTCMNLYNVTNDICDCPDGFKPADCSSKVSCADEPCENKGLCKKNGSKAKCSCRDGFGGYYCEQEKNHCKNSPCNNNATCLDLQNGFRCLCTSNFTGDKCDDLTHKVSENQENPSKQNVPAWIAALASVGGLLAVVGLSICIYKFKPDNATRTESIAANQTKRIKPKVTKIQPVETPTVNQILDSAI